MIFKDELQQLNITLSDMESSLFEKYYEKLVSVNEVMNLTAITEHDEVYSKHFLDSLSIVKALDLSKEFTLCDVGSGAGFPSIPLAIVNSNVHVTIIDALNKRIKFLNELVSELELKNVEAIHARAEEFVKTKREFYDVVTARAVARLNVLAELCMPLVKVGGSFVAMKGSSGDDELREAKKAIATLGGEVERIIPFTLPDQEGERQIIVARKIKASPLKYPRAFAKIKEKPL